MKSSVIPNVKGVRSTSLTEESSSINRLLTSYRPLLKFFLFFTIIYLVATSALLLADVYYADDVGRAGFGYTAWASFSRYVSEFLSHFLHADSYLTDISPLPQILALLISALSSTLLLYAFIGKKLFTLTWKKYAWLIVAITPLVLCPYFLECLSYKYDAPYMALSVLAAIIPIFFRHHKKWQFILATLICTLFICISYQTSLGILPMLLVFFAFKDWFTGDFPLKVVIKRLILAALSMLAALLFFKFCLMSDVDLYVSNEFPPISSFFDIFFTNLRTYFAMLFSDFKFFWLLLISVICLLFPLSAVQKTTKNQFACLGLAFLTEGIMALFIFIFYSIFDKPLFAPRAAYNIGAFIALTGLFIVYYAKNLLPKLVITALSWCFFVFSLTYGNALKVQDEYVNTKLENVAADLNQLNLGSETRALELSGNIGQSPIITNMTKNEQILTHLLESSYSDRIVWNNYRLAYLCDFCHFDVTKTPDLTNLDLPLLKSTSEYDIFGDNSHILIYFNTP